MYNIDSYAVNELMALGRATRIPDECLSPDEPAVTYDDFLDMLPETTAASMRCNACRAWWDIYASVVYITNTGVVTSPFWASVGKRAASEHVQKLATNLSELVTAAFHERPLTYRVSKSNRQIRGSSVIVTQVAGVSLHPSNGVCVANFLWKTIPILRPLLPVANILNRLVICCFTSHEIVGAVGNHFGHIHTPSARSSLPHVLQGRYENYITERLGSLVSNRDVLVELLSTIPLPLHTPEQLEVDIKRLIDGFSGESRFRLYRALTNLPNGARYVFDKLNQKSGEWFLEKELYEKCVDIDSLRYDSTFQIDGVKELLERLKNGVSTNTPMIQRQWDMVRIEDRHDLPNYVPVKQSTAPVLSEKEAATYQFTAEKIIELTRSGRLTKIIPNPSVTKIRVQVPSRTADRENLVIQLENTSIETNWFLLNSAVSVTDRLYVEGWVLNPVDGGQGLLAAVVTATEAGVCKKPNSKLQPTELGEVLPDAELQTLFLHSEKQACPDLKFAVGDIVTYDLHNMPMLGELDGKFIQFVQVRPADI